MIIIIAREIYGLKISVAEWRAKLAETLKLLGYTSSKSDSDVWMKWKFNSNGYYFYKYMLCYVDDLVHICFNKIKK